MDPSVPFKASFELTEKELVLSYEVQNRGGRDLYLYNRVTWDDPQHSTPDIVYVHFERDDRTIWLNKRIPAIPNWPGVDFGEVACPFVTPVRVGATFREEVHVPLPVKERRFYGRGPRDDGSGTPRLAIYDRVRFTVQYFWRTEGEMELIEDFGGTSQILTRGGARHKPSDFGFLESERVPLRVPVLAVDP